MKYRLSKTHMRTNTVNNVKYINACIISKNKRTQIAPSSNSNKINKTKIVSFHIPDPKGILSPFPPGGTGKEKAGTGATGALFGKNFFDG
jgi:hypothetical protein